jgi:hypothetical protein
MKQAYQVYGLVRISLEVVATSEDEASEILKKTQLADLNIGDIVPTKAALLEGLA